MHAALALLFVLVHLGGATLSGTVRDSETGAPVAGALVQVGDAGRLIHADPQGRYRIAELREGLHSIRVWRYGYREQALQVFAEAGTTLRVDVELEPVPVPITGLLVVSRRAPGERDDAGPRSRRADVGGRAYQGARLLDGTALTEPDVAAAFATAPDVLADPETPSALRVRGGSSDQNRVLLDGLPLLAPFHAAESFSALDPDALGRVNLYAGVEPARFGGGLSSVMSARLAPPARAKLESRGAVSLTAARATFDGPLSRRASLLVGLRGATSAPLGRADATYLGHGAGDALGALRWGGARDSLELVGFASDDHLRFSAGVPADSASASARIAALQTTPQNAFGWRSATLGAAWRHRGDTWTRTLRVWEAGYRARILWEDSATALALETRRSAGGGEVGWTAHRGTLGSALGLGVQRERVGYSVAPGAPTAPASGFRADGTPTELHAFAEESGTFAPRWSGDVGVRAAWVLPREPLLEPRVSLEYALSRRASVSLGYAATHQLVQSAANRESLVASLFEAGLPVPTDGQRWPIARSHQLTADFDADLPAGLHLQLYAYARRMHGLVMAAPATGEPFALQSLAVGDGSARGLGGTLTRSTRHAQASLSYGYAHVTRKAVGRPFTPLSAPAQQLRAALVARPRAGTSLQASLLAQFERPALMLADEVSWEGCNALDGGCEAAGSPVHPLGLPGAHEAPAYLRLDLGVRQRLRLPARSLPEITAYARADNLLNRFNIRGFGRDVAGAMQPLQMSPRALVSAGIEWRP